MAWRHAAPSFCALRKFFLKVTHPLLLLHVHLLEHPGTIQLTSKAQQDTAERPQELPDGSPLHSPLSDTALFNVTEDPCQATHSLVLHTTIPDTGQQHFSSP